MKALTLYQPWAALMVAGEKRFETRGWRTDYHGWLAIHAGLERGNLDLAHREPFATALIGEPLVLGMIIGVVSLVGCQRTDDLFSSDIGVDELAFGDWTPGRWAWRCADPMRFVEPIPHRGAMGLWTPRPAIEAEIRRLMNAERKAEP